ncbi:MAG: cobaltochelatase subunit CobN [Cellvibrionaceae bacterium]|nr:cobaltochelatase subunit CobN [Cellvibrionaceae bacterium]
MATLTQQTIQQTRTLTLLLAAFLALGFNTLAQAHGDSDHVHPEQYSVLFVSAGHSNKAKVSRLKELLEQSGDKLGLKISQKAQADLGEPLEALNYFSRFDLVVLDAVSARSSKQAYGVYLPLLKQVDLGKTKLLAINWLSEKALTIGIDSADAKALHDYYDNGGRENLSRMLVFSSCKVLQQQDCQVPKAIEFPSIGFYHPDYEQLIFADRASFMAWRKAPADKPLIGLSMQRAMVESMETQLVDAAIKAIEAKGAIALPYYFEMSPRASNYLPLLQEQSEQGPRTVVDAIINLRSIHWADKRHAEFSRLGVPVLQGLQYYDGDQQTWEQDTQGISPMMTPFALVLPETAGVIDPTTIAAKDDISEQTQVIDYQLQYLVDKTLRHSQLKRKANRDKKLAVMVWGSSDVGASFLNVPDSLRAIAGRLNAEGYSIPAVEESYFTDQVDAILEPFYRAYELDTLLNNDQAELMPVDEYKAWFAKLPKPNRERITEHWGQPEDNFMVVERDGKQQFVIPRIRAGNMLVLRQPPRSDSADKEQGMYHKKTIPVNHYYLAAYYYVRKYFGSDAIIHLGTHGSQEYLPGKERALSVYDDGNLAVGDTPVFYPFIVDDVGEAMQTKRRGNATVLAHMTPPFAAAGLQGKLADIHELMHQYNSLDEGGVKVKTGKQIVATCLNEKLCEDMNWDQPKIDADFPAFLDALHEYMEDLAAQNQPLGLHSFGELPRQALQISTLLQMLGGEFLTPASEYEKKHYSGNIDLHQHDDGRSNVFSQIFTSEEDESLQNLAGFKLLRDWVVSPTAEAAAINALADPAARQQRWQSEFGEPLATLLSSARKHYANYAGIEELNNLVKGLQGEFIEVRNGGDPIRHPESLPTGFNLIGFDPSKVPTKAAWEQGAELTEQLIADYYKKHGRYPDKLAFSLWSIETMRHYGVLEAQAMRAMGVEPEWAPGGRVSGFKITPASELKRPRVDVVLSATGLYRDAFPNIMQRLAKSIEAVAKLKEEGNSLWKNSQRIAEQLKAEGMDAEEAEYLSSVRIFSNQSGNYGSGVNNSVFNPETWESDAKIADLYMGKMGYYFGADKDRWGQRSHRPLCQAALRNRCRPVFAFIQCLRHAQFRRPV